MEFDYPIDYSLYNIEEITIIINFLDLVLESSEKEIDLAKLKESYKNFKNVVKSKSEENNLYKEFKKVSNIDVYSVVKKIK